MELEEAIERLKRYLSDIEKMGYKKLPNDEAIDTVIAELDRLQKENKEKIEDIAYKTRLAEGDLEILEKHSINHWYNFAYVQEAVAVDNLRNRINDIQDLLKEE